MNTSYHEVPGTFSGERLDITVTRLMPELTRARVQKLILEELILVNGVVRKANFRVKEGQTLVVSIPENKPSSAEPQAMQLEILYEDQDLLDRKSVV